MPIPYHRPVLLKESMFLLDPFEGGIFVDGTLGGGGHAFEIAKRIGPMGRLIAIDLDPQAIEAGKEKLQEFGKRTIFVNDNFVNLPEILEKLGIKAVNGVLLDLGVSSFQIDCPERGFSYSEKKTNLSSPLDMRMDPHQPFSASEILNSYSANELERIFSNYGEERYARRVAKGVLLTRREKKLETIESLLSILKKTLPSSYVRCRKPYARRIFQALRMEVNQELPNLEKFLINVYPLLSPGARLVVISFHSLEDRLVKRKFKEWGEEGRVKILTEKLVTPSASELATNPRSASAKLRAAEKI